MKDTKNLVMPARVDWRTLLLNLQEAGVPGLYIKSVTNISSSSISTYLRKGEPSHIYGQRLLTVYRFYLPHKRIPKLAAGIVRTPKIIKRPVLVAAVDEIPPS